MLVLIFVVVWTACFIIFNDLHLPSKSVNKYDNVLCVFAHMDDETVLAGGIMARSVHQGKHVTLMTLTKGEKGNATRKVDPELPAVQKAELSKVLSTLGVKNLVHLNYEDDTLNTKKQALKNDIEAVIKKVKPDLVVTFDLAGWYGHADHIACAEAVTEIMKKNYPRTALWYAVRPEAVNRAARLVARLARRDPINLRTAPTHKIYIGSSVFKKIRGLYFYKSQMSALRRGVTVGPIPMWFFMSTQPFEYILKAN